MDFAKLYQSTVASSLPSLGDCVADALAKHEARHTVSYVGDIVSL